MKLIAAALVLFSLPNPHFAPPVAAPVVAAAAKPARKGGRWYLAQTGHAVYCYGPVMTVRQPEGDLRRVATYCQGGDPMVPLRD